MTGFDPKYEHLAKQLRQVALIKSCSSGLSWDEQTYMPTGGSAHRSEQLGYLAGLAHEKATDAELGDLIHDLLQNAGTHKAADGSASVVMANLREAKRAYDRATKLPQQLVEELSRTVSLSQQAWINARKDNDFSAFLPWLEKLVSLKREEAAAVGSASGVAYDALLDEYEPGMTAAEVQTAFEPLRQALVTLLQEITQSKVANSNSILEQHYPKAAQRVFAEAAARQIGFDFDRGRIDESAHPFCSGFGPGDVRLTTRYLDHHFSSAFFGVLHEAGHGIYEQGLPEDQFGLASGEAASLGVHESQSRLWENFVGRGKPFWEWFYPSAQQAFPHVLKNVSLGEFYAAINHVQPSLIRVEADEVTYNLHIMLRFQLEQQLISGSLAPADLPQAWNSQFAADFGLTVPDDAHGCLQDIHWSAGLMGYFPTYTLGNMYAAQLFEKAALDLKQLLDQIRTGQFRPLKAWLGEHVHGNGRRFPARELMQRATGHTLSHDALVKHLRGKYAELYKL